MIDPTLSMNERIDLMKSTFSDCDEIEVLKYASRNDSQALVDVMDEASIHILLPPNNVSAGRRMTEPFCPISLTDFGSSGY